MSRNLHLSIDKFKKLIRVTLLFFNLCRVFFWRASIKNVELKDELINLIEYLDKSNRLKKSLFTELSLVNNGSEVDFRELCSLHFKNRQLANYNQSRFLGDEFAISIGHTAIGLGTRSKAIKLGLLHEKQFCSLYYRAANEHLIEHYFSNIFPTVKVPRMVYQSIYEMDRNRFETVGYFSVGLEPEPLHEYVSYIEQNWVSNFAEDFPLFTISAADRSFAKSELFKMGVTKPFFVLHVRNNGDLTSLRNCSIENYSELILLAESKGAQVVFLGDDAKWVKEHLHYPNLINYSAHPLRSARLDIAVLALSEGVIATTSGPLHVANLFGKKSLWTNAVGFSGFPFLQNTFFVPKLWYEEINSRRKLITRQKCSRPLLNLYFLRIYQFPNKKVFCSVDSHQVSKRIILVGLYRV
jgi:putative glycosyltransferase (TIGR04372 family)